MKNGNEIIYGLLKNILDDERRHHTSPLEWMKAHLDDIRKPIFRLQHLFELDKNITYRQINHWERTGLINPKRINNKRGWRRFSITDAVILLIIKDMKVKLYL